MQAPKKDAMRHAEELKTAKEHAMGAATAGPGAVYPGAEATSPPQLVPLSVYPQPEATSPSPSPTPQ